MRHQIPLAERLRPSHIDEYIGQTHILSPNSILRQHISAGMIPSLIFWGPPGVGKTTLALLIAKAIDRPFFSLSAINSGVKDVREIIEKAESNTIFTVGKNPIVFIDEIHRFSKSQQDALLGAVEKGTITLIGATTENPSFEVISALISRCQVYILKRFDQNEMLQLIERALSQDVVLKALNVVVQEHDALIDYANGDGRKLLNSLDLVITAQLGKESILVNNATVLDALQQTTIRYDKNGEEHYDIISAFIKSIRGSDPNAAVYWLARMLEGGEDPKFLARRLVISAAEDIGLANPNALLLANTCFDAVHKVGMPESRIILSEVAIYLATSPKSNSAYAAINQAMALVKKTGNLPVPLHLRNAPTELMKKSGYGLGYKYPHDYSEGFVSQEYLPESISNKVFYTPKNNPSEFSIVERLKKWWSK